MKGINGPLQQRTTVLDLDSERANTPAADYDTDLESEWSNPSEMTLFFLSRKDLMFEQICLLMEMIFHWKMSKEVEMNIINEKWRMRFCSKRVKHLCC